MWNSLPEELWINILTFLAAHPDHASMFTVNSSIYLLRNRMALRVSHVSGDSFCLSSRTLAEALAKSSSGSTILLDPGTWHLTAPIVISHPLHLIGGGVQGEVIIILTSTIDSGVPAFTINHRGFRSRFSNVRIVHEKDEADARGQWRAAEAASNFYNWGLPVTGTDDDGGIGNVGLFDHEKFMANLADSTSCLVRLSEGSLEISSCNLACDVNVAIACARSATKLVVHNSNIRCHSVGLLVLGGTCDITDSRIAGAELCGIALGQGSEGGRIVRCEVSNGLKRGIGICVKNSRGATALRNCHIKRCYGGIYVDETSRRVRVSNVKLWRNRQFGLSVLLGADAVVEVDGCDFSRNESANVQCMVLDGRDSALTMDRCSASWSKTGLAILMSRSVPISSQLDGESTCTVSLGKCVFEDNEVGIIAKQPTAHDSRGLILLLEVDNSRISDSRQLGMVLSLDMQPLPLTLALLRSDFLYNASGNVLLNTHSLAAVEVLLDGNAMHSLGPTNFVTTIPPSGITARHNCFFYSLEGTAIRFLRCGFWELVRFVLPFAWRNKQEDSMKDMAGDPTNRNLFHARARRECRANSSLLLGRLCGVMALGMLGYFFFLKPIRSVKSPRILR